MNLDLNLFPLLCFCVSLCITLCSVSTRLFPSFPGYQFVFCLPQHVCFRVSFVLSVPTALFLSVPGYHFVFCLRISVSVCPWVSLCALSPLLCFCLSLGITLYPVSTCPFPSVLCSVCPHCSVSVCPWVFFCVLFVPTRLFPSLTGCSGCPRNLSLSVSGKCALLRVGVHLVQAQNHFLFSPLCSKARVLSAMLRRQFPCMSSLRTLTPLKL